MHACIAVSTIIIIVLSSLCVVAIATRNIDVWFTYRKWSLTGIATLTLAIYMRFTLTMLS